MFREFSLNRLLVLIVAVGFLFLAVETTLERWNVFSQEPFAFVPVVFSIVGLIGSIASLVQWREPRIRLLNVILFVSLAVGTVGLYLHSEVAESEPVTAEERAHEQKESKPPPLAPLSFAGLAVVGLLATSRKWKAEVVDEFKH